MDYGDQLTLYRGDATKIKTFDFNKTNDYCLVGQGIYLTDKVIVAESYRGKGSNTANEKTLFHGEASSKGEALEFAKDSYLYKEWQKTHPGTAPPKNKIKDLWEKHKYKFLNHLDNDEITVQANRYPKGVIYTVVLNDSDPEGYLTKFVFPKKHFLSNVIDVDKTYPDEGFLEIIYETQTRINPKFNYGCLYLRVSQKKKKQDETLNNFVTTYPSFESFKRATQRKGLLNMGLNWNNYIPILKTYGILGYRYSGGRHMGGCGTHNAYSIWDDEFVNDHKVSRMR